MQFLVFSPPNTYSYFCPNFVAQNCATSCLLHFAYTFDSVTLKRPTVPHLKDLFLNKQFCFYKECQSLSCVHFNRLTADGLIFQFKSWSSVQIRITFKANKSSVGWRDEVGRKKITTVFSNARRSTRITIVQVQTIKPKIKKSLLIQFEVKCEK